ncbi:MAG: glutamine synthetase [Candidatus Thorarchaeota archaeon]|nr:MAG: glutamine synthetase [Candidatus Thorarchaeota archaeon]
MAESFRYIELQLVDILGRVKAMTIPSSPLNSLEELGTDTSFLNGTSIDGSSILGLASVEASDLRLVPDPESLVDLPYTKQRTAAALCFVRDKIESEGQHYPKDCRGALHRVCEEHLPGSLSLKVKVEPEFSFITFEGEPYDDGGYADVYPAVPSSDILMEIADAIQRMGMQPRVIHHEVGEAQQEIELDFEDVTVMADNIIRFKALARAIALAHGIDVSFLPKPFAGSAGNGLHCHLQLWDGKKNLFGSEGTSNLSEKGEWFVAGLLAHSSALTAIANPSINSFKRLVPHHEAPVYKCWGPMNRTALIREPLFSQPEKAAIEFRSPDPLANPYLLFSAIIASGMDGINRQLSPPSPISRDVFQLSEEKLRKLRVEMLPSSLDEAIDYLENDKVIRDALGDHIFETYVKIKRKESEDYMRGSVTDWEWRRYQDI